jgi:hypothetical protein
MNINIPTRSDPGSEGKAGVGRELGRPAYGRPPQAASAGQPTPGLGPSGGKIGPHNKVPHEIGGPQQNTKASLRNEELCGAFHKGAEITTRAKHHGSPTTMGKKTNQPKITSFPTQVQSQRVGVNKVIVSITQPTPGLRPPGGKACPNTTGPQGLWGPQKHTKASLRKEELQGDFRTGAVQTNRVKIPGRPTTRGINITQPVITSFPTQALCQRVGVNKVIAGNAAQRRGGRRRRCVLSLKSTWHADDTQTPTYFAADGVADDEVMNLARASVAAGDSSAPPASWVRSPAPASCESGTRSGWPKGPPVKPAQTLASGRGAGPAVRNGERER